MTTTRDVARAGVPTPPKVQTYGQIPNVLEIPNLIKLQVDSFAWLTSFRGDPKAASNRDWNGKPCRVNSLTALDEGGNTFFNIATLKVQDGTVSRKEANFEALRVVVLDDVGSKATLPEGIEPSYLIETSSGNFQAGLILESPCRDLATINPVSTRPSRSCAVCAMK